MSVAPLSTTPGTYYYGRSYSVAAQGVVPGQGAVWGNESPGQTPLRVKFSAELSLADKPKAKVTVYNLSPLSRAKLVNNVPVRLRAGYLGMTGTIFTGIIAKVTTEREGPDIALTMDLVDAEPFVNMSVLDKSYPAGTALIDILNDVAAAMSVEFNSGAVVRVAHGVGIGIPNPRYARGFVAHGPVKDTLDKLCRPNGLEWYVVTGALQVVPKTHYDGGTVRILGIESGLIGVPGDSGDFKTMASLLNPKLTPGRLVQLKSANQALSGYYKIRKATFEGDSHGESWSTSLEAVAYDGKIVPLPSSAGGSFAAAAVP